MGNPWWQWLKIFIDEKSTAEAVLLGVFSETGRVIPVPSCSPPWRCF
jgi:hypothetical protein